MEDFEEEQISQSDGSRKRGAFSKQFISRLKPAEREYRIWDTKSQGLGVRVTRNTKTFFVAYCSSSFRWERILIGRFGDLSVEDARDKAHAIRRDAANGVDPRQEIRRKKDISTVEELCCIYLKDGVAFKKASTIATDRGRVTRHIIPLPGTVKIDQLQKFDI